VQKRGKYGKYKNKKGASALQHVVYLLEYRTGISPLKYLHKNGEVFQLPTKFNIFCE
jgi:hypothetical protein